MSGGGGGKGWGEAVDPFRLITTTLLSLLLPLSFLLLSRLSSSSFFLSLTLSPPQPQTASSSSSFFLYTNSAFVCIFVSSISVSTLLHGLVTKITPGDRNRSIATSFSPPHVSVSWLIFIIVQISVLLGLERTVSEGVVNRIIISSERSFLIRFFFFFGLHDVMLLWYRVIVRPVVDSTLLGEGFRDHVREETVAEKVAFAASCGTFWWWKLRDEVEALVGAAESKKELFLLLQIDGNVATVDFVNWWLYYLVVTIGMVRIVKGSLTFAMILVFEQRRRRNPCDISIVSTDSFVHYDDEGDNKV